MLSSSTTIIMDMYGMGSSIMLPFGIGPVSIGMSSSICLLLIVLVVLAYMYSRDAKKNS